jgi:hypothetical protein
MRIATKIIALLTNVSPLLLGLLFSVGSFADVESRMPLSQMTMDSPGLNESGPVHVELIQSNEGITKLEITAFGKTRSLSASQLALLGKQQFNGAVLSESPGYGGRFGHGIYLILSQGYSSGISVVAKITVYEREDAIRVNIGKPSQLP